MLKILRCRVHGRVQGVFFRDSTRREALRLGLSGHALNLDDGSVEVLVSGASEAVDALRSWLHRGPPRARVDAVECQPATAEVSPGFRIG